MSRQELYVSCLFDAEVELVELLRRSFQFFLARELFQISRILAEQGESQV